jgi:exonuclease SbcD
MRILHTSDWHLGFGGGPLARSEDHERFLDWLLQTLRDSTVDVLVVAGDIFDALQPSAEAQEQYFRFLARLPSTGTRCAVIVGGNHDSASRLDAPAELLGALHIHVIGGLPQESQLDRCLVPLPDRDGGTAAVALAVPYFHEFRLGVRGTEMEPPALRALFTDRFAALYTRLADMAQARWPGLPLLCTGHLALSTAGPEDYLQEIHLIGQIGCLPETILDDRVQYAALGHLHGLRPLRGGRAWYCGTPLPFTVAEAKSPRRVLLVDLDPRPEGQATVTPLKVPIFRALLELRAPPDPLVQAVRDLVWSEPLPPLLFLRTVTDEPQPVLVRRLHEALAEFPENRRPRLADLRYEATAPSEGDTVAIAPTLEESTPREIFATLCRARGLSEAANLEQAFATLQAYDADSFEAELDRILEDRP